MHFLRLTQLVKLAESSTPYPRQILNLLITGRDYDMKSILSRAFSATRMSFLAVLACPAGLSAQTPFALPEGQSRVLYEFRIPAEGGTAPLHWKVSDGSLPEGIELDDTGVLKGTPASAAARSSPYQFAVEVSDSSSPPQRFSMPFSLVIKAAPLRIALGATPLRIVPAANTHSSPPPPEPAAASSGNASPPPSPASPPPAAPPAADTPAAPPVAPAPSNPPQTETNKKDCEETEADCRDDFEASAYVGAAIDTFASEQTRRYLNPADTAAGTKERAVVGFDFAYRLLDKPFGESTKWPNQLWVYGETVHGSRSSDIDCKEHAAFPTCKAAIDAALPGRAADEFLFVFRNASSLEGFMGFRWEFLSLNPGSDDRANLYLKAQAGFLTASGVPDSAVAVHHIGLGAIATRGFFQDSYLEIGHGRTDLFADRSRRRWKIDGFLTWPLCKIFSSLKGVNVFSQITVDTDLGPGSDSIQSYIGLDFDLRRMFRGPKKSEADCT